MPMCTTSIVFNYFLKDYPLVVIMEVSRVKKIKNEYGTLRVYHCNDIIRMTFIDHSGQIYINVKWDDIECQLLRRFMYNNT